MQQGRAQREAVVQVEQAAPAATGSADSQWRKHRRMGRRGDG
jgi:hypothetical protein